MPGITLKEAESFLPEEEKPNIGNVFDDLKERISSPFIFSFVLSFLVANWRILIGLIFLDRADLKARGIKDKLDFVYLNLSWYNAFFWPLGGALFYCFVYPWLRDIIKIEHAKRATKTTKAINKVAINYPVPMSKYIAKTREVAGLNETLSKLITDESQTQNENIKLKVEKVSILNQITDLEKGLQNWYNFNSPDILNGNWDYSYSMDAPVMTIQINNSKVYRYINSQLVPIYDIKNFHGDPRNRTVIFQLIPVGNELDRHTHALTIVEGFESMEGMEDWAHPVLYKAALQL
jgi:hypothetical protein